MRSRLRKVPKNQQTHAVAHAQARRENRPVGVAMPPCIHGSRYRLGAGCGVLHCELTTTRGSPGTYCLVGCFSKAGAAVLLFAYTVSPYCYVP